MTLNEFRYATKSGFRSLGRHPFLLIASVTTLTLMLCVLSLFLAASLNASHLSEIAAQQPPITISMRVKADESSIEAMREYLASRPDEIIEYNEYTPEMNFESFKKDMGKEELWEGFSVEDNIPCTFNLRLSDPSLADELKADVEAMPDVYEVLMESETMRLLDRITVWTNRVGLLVFVVLALVASLIVSNMIRVAILSRGHEINIMKYLGATKAFIQLPFIIEGLIAGLIGALLASLFSGLVYSFLQNRFNPSAQNISNGTFYFLNTSKVIAIVSGVNFLVALILCLFASGISARRHAKV